MRGNALDPSWYVQDIYLTLYFLVHVLVDHLQMVVWFLLRNFYFFKLLLPYSLGDSIPLVPWVSAKRGICEISTLDMEPNHSL